MLPGHSSGESQLPQKEKVEKVQSGHGQSWPMNDNCAVEITVSNKDIDHEVTVYHIDHFMDKMSVEMSWSV